MPEITDKFGKASNGSNYAEATTVITNRLPGESVLACQDLSAFSQTTPVFFLTYRKTIDPETNETLIVDQTAWKAIVNPDNNTLTDMMVAPGYTDNGNPVGQYVEPIPTSFWADELVDGLLRSLNPDGSLKSESSDVTGVVKQFAGATAPNGYLICDGSAISRTEYADLFAVIGTTYGSGNNSTTFNIPDARGRVVAGYNADETEFNELGKKVGSTTHTLTASQLPDHTHQLGRIATNYGFSANASGYAGDAFINQSSRLATTRAQPGTTGQAHNNMQPTLSLNHIIKT